MSITGTVLKAVFDKVDGTLAYPVSPGLRRMGDPTPAVVYELTSVDFDVAADGLLNKTGRASVKFDCVADAAKDAYDLAVQVIQAIDGAWTGTGSCYCVLAGAGIQQSRANPDDGQGDAERIATVTAEILFKEV